MSFLGKLGAGLRLIAANPISSTLITAANPALGAIYNSVVGKMLQVEAEHESKGLVGTGPQKHDTVVGDFNERLAITQATLAPLGKQLTYDGSLLDKAIKEQNEAFHSFAKLQASMKLIDVVQQ